MITVEELKLAIEDIIGLPKFEKMLEFSSLLTEYFEESLNIQPIIVGGLSVEIYTRSSYTTHDIDFVSPGWEKFHDILTKLGFTKIEREWYHTDLEIAVEVPASHLEGSMERVNELILPNNRKIYVIGIEDIIIHRLEGIIYKRYPKDDEDYEWAKRIYLIHQENLDMEYLISEGNRSKTIHFIEEWLNEKAN
jgi:hypothetical protein